MDTENFAGKDSPSLYIARSAILESKKSYQLSALANSGQLACAAATTGSEFDLLDFGRIVDLPDRLRHPCSQKSHYYNVIQYKYRYT